VGALDPAPRRAGPTWRQFLVVQAHAIVACDFLAVETVPLKRSIGSGRQRSEQIADVIAAVTASGWEIRVRCEPPWNSVMCECARCAMLSSEAAVMIWSPVLMKYQDGTVFHAAAFAGVVKAAVEAPR
jgi:hypothetical protein